MAILIILLIILVIVLIKNKTKRLKYNSILLITGSLKTGKTALAVKLAISEHKKVHRIWVFKKFLHFGKKEEEPLLYSNIPLRYKFYIPLTEDVLLRKKRVAYKSIVLLSESSLVADSQNFRNEELNENVTLFCKLYAHESKGGKIFIETQNVYDNHYAFKRITNNYVYIQSNIKIPFFMVYKVRELLFSEDGNVQNSINSDLENDLKTMFISKRVWKYYDRYCYSVLTDNLDYDCAVLTKEQLEKLDLKANTIVSFNKYKYLKRSVKENE